MNRLACTALSIALAVPAAGSGQAPAPAEKLTFHHDAARSGWNPAERVLTPAAVAGGRFGPLWASPALDGFGDTPARLFAVPLYVADVAIGGRRRAAVIAVTTTGYAYAIDATPGVAAPGAILWRTQLASRPCEDGTAGNLSTPVIDRAAGRVYVTSCDDAARWRLHALDLTSGQETAGWPLRIDAAAINRPGINRNSENRYTDERLIIQRGALNLSADGKRLYVAIGPDSTGWLVVVDTARAAVASAFSSTARVAEDQGGMWASAGPSVDAEGRIHIATGSKFLARARAGVAGIFPDATHNWAQSVLQFRDDPERGLVLTGTYTPFNWCTAGSNDIDLGASGTVAIDLPAGASATPRLLAIGGKQGNFYLLDRDRLPGGTERRPPCTTEPDRDGSLLAPEPQPHFGLRGPVNVFGPYSDYVSMLDQAKSRSTPAWWRDAAGRVQVYATGSAKVGRDFATSAPPGLARIVVSARPDQPAYPEVAALEETQTFHNPGSPVISSNGGRDGIVWVLDTGGPRSASLYGPEAPRPVLYAFDAATLKLLWKNAPGVLKPGGKYNEATVVKGLVLVGTDRIQAFGVGARRAAVPAAPAKRKPVPATALPRAAAASPVPAAPAAALAAGQRTYRARCASCHSAGQPGTPSRAMLGRIPRARIVDALLNGVMKPMAAGMSRGDADAVARFLTEGK